ncbi:hypothetical protein T11_9478, partial [Trichinella zimbabwensis]
LKSAKNDFSGNFHENRPVSTQSAKNDFSGNFEENHLEIFAKIAQ